MKRWRWKSSKQRWPLIHGQQSPLLISTGLQGLFLRIICGCMCMFVYVHIITYIYICNLCPRKIKYPPLEPRFSIGSIYFERIMGEIILRSRDLNIRVLRYHHEVETCRNYPGNHSLFKKRVNIIDMRKSGSKKNKNKRYSGSTNGKLRKPSDFSRLHHSCGLFQP